MKNPTESFVPTKRIIVLIDLAGCTKAFQSNDDAKMAAFLQDYYVACEKVLTEGGGTIIKFMGDACLAVFPADQARSSVEAVIKLQSVVNALAAQRISDRVTLGANMHLATAIDAEFGAGANKRRDVIGRGVNQTFLLGRGTGIRISEPLYRALPSGARSPWTKHKPPAVYHMDAAEGILEGLRQSAISNTLRW